MVKHLMTQRVSVPTVYVTKGRQRVKQYDNTVYLKNGNEFEIELFNPTSNKILAKISINGKSLGAGMVIRPGERVFLERYFDEAKKFLFETYVVDGADYNAQQAIKLNGIVDVEFYDQYTPNVITFTTSPTYVYYNNTYTTCGTGQITGIQSKSYVDGTPRCYSLTANSIGSLVNANSIGSSFVDSAPQQMDRGFEQQMDYSAPIVPIETGRVEKGSHSDQGFVTDVTTFNSYYSWKTTWTILPESQKPIVIEDLSVYCTNCGTKRKKTNHKFCPNCGNKF